MALYAVFVHELAPEESNVAVAGEIPDFPGCFVAADSWEDFPAAVREAAEVYFQGEDLEIPPPSSLGEMKQREAYADGQWVLVDIDPNRLNTRKERVNLSIPAYALREIDEYAARIGETRSRLLYATALKLIRGQLDARQDTPIP
ncbi:MAG: type II toxin-antitoxin system HicB family antitoxin [Pseudomonadota bacterium]